MLFITVDTFRKTRIKHVSVETNINSLETPLVKANISFFCHLISINKSLIPCY